MPEMPISEVRWADASRGTAKALIADAIDNARDCAMLAQVATIETDIGDVVELDVDERALFSGMSQAWSAIAHAMILDMEALR